MKQTKIKRFIFVLCAILTFGFVFTGFSFGVQSHADVDPTLAEQIITYQGENNWYLYSGDFEGKDLRYMLYSPYNNLWQGQGEQSRLFSLSLIQMPSANYDTVRAKIISKDGRVTVAGKVEYYADVNTGSSVTVGVMLAKGGDLSNVTPIVDYTVLSSAEDNFFLGEGVSEVDVNSGDVIFFISKATGEKSAGVIFDIDFIYTEITSSSAPENGVLAKNLIIGEGDATLNYENDANALRDKVGIVQNAMQVQNDGEHLNYVYQPAGLNRIVPMDFAGYNSPGWWFSMPNSLNSVGAVWQNKFYSNPNSGYGWSGIAYTAPASGTISVIGGAARSSASEKGDDGALMGEPEEWARWDLVVITSAGFKTVASDTIVAGQLRSIEAVDGTQGIQLKKGEQVFLRYVCSSPWKVACITAGFNFVAQPVDTFEGWQVSADVTGEEFSSNQGDNNTYYAYGDVDDKYYLFNQENGVYNGGNVYANVSVSAEATDVSSAFENMRIYKAVGSGTATVKGNFIQKTFDLGTVSLSVYKRAYNGNGWNAKEELFTATTTQRKVFAEFVLDVSVNNGDLIFVSLVKEGEATSPQTVSGVLNTSFSINVTEPADEIEGVGEVVSQMKSDQFATEQGATGWFYAYGTSTNYVLMDYGYGKVNYNCWSGPEWNNRIEVGKMFPSPYTASILIYVAPADGTFVAEGTVGILSTDGLTGVTVNVLKNNDTVSNNRFDYNDFAVRSFAFEIEVTAGDVIMFVVENNAGDTVAYFTEVLLNFAYELQTEETEFLSGDELLNKLSPKSSYAEYIGIQDNFTKVEDNVIQSGSTAAATKKGCGGVAGTSAALLGAVCLTAFVLKRRGM